VAASPTVPLGQSGTAPAPKAEAGAEPETIHDLQPDDSVGEYRVVGILGRGGFGVVYEAIQPVIGKRVAIKVLNLRYSTDPVFVNRFTAEARAVNQIRHRHIIDIFSFGQLPDGRQYYVMELLHGQTLSKYLNARGRLAPAEAVPILEAIAKALDAAHSQQIAHRDLKPDNVFIVLDAADDDGKAFPKLLDFGIAKLLARSQVERVHPTITGGLVGTPPFMSPEQCKGEQVDHRTDVYSLGVIAYDALTGRLPFLGKSDVEVMWKHITEPPAAPSTVAELPAALDAPILAMLEKEPFKRPDSAGAAIRKLAEAIGHETARPSTSMRVERPTAPTPPRASEAETAPTLAGTGNALSAPVAPVSASVAPVVGTRRRWLTPVLLGALAAAAVAAGVLMRGSDEKKPVISASVAPDAAPRIAGAAPDAAPVVAAAGVDAGVPAVVSIEILGTPSDTEVRAGGKFVGGVPGAISLPRGDQPVELTFSKSGYVTAKKSIVPRADAKLEMTLRKTHKITKPQSEIPPW
jgi:eukaryotic-like serine/threonine-protein kinase